MKAKTLVVKVNDVDTENMSTRCLTKLRDWLPQSAIGMPTVETLGDIPVGGPFTTLGEQLRDLNANVLVDTVGDTLASTHSKRSSR